MRSTIRAGRRGAAMVASLAAVLLMMVSPAGAATATAPYDDKATQAVASPDATGNGTATATSDADAATGAISLSLAASETAPVGASVFGIGIGSSRADGNARVLHRIRNLTAGTYVVKMSIGNITGSVATSDNFQMGITGAYAQAYGTMTAYYEQCTTDDQNVTTCAPVISGSTLAGNVKPVVYCPNAGTTCSPQIASSVSLVGLITIPDGQTGNIYFDGGLVGAVQVTGENEASLSLQGTVLSVEANLA